MLPMLNLHAAAAGTTVCLGDVSHETERLQEGQREELCHSFIEHEFYFL